jgi:phosphoribosylaminoimidazolecarboxamide formyltransferase / IMP cyclohydrolase
MSTDNIIPLNTNPLKIRRALISVSDKNGVLKLAAALHKMGVEIVSTGGTCTTIRQSGVPVTDVSEITGFPECLDGRVKTLHPNVHAGILARTSYDGDNRVLEELQIKPFELVVVNLYPFRNTIEKPDTTLEKAIEFVDIGGPTMVRAAAKNFPHVCILTDAQQYDGFIDELMSGDGICFDTRLALARDAFQHTADYDTHIAGYLTETTGQTPAAILQISQPLAEIPRYGENPHQKATVYGQQSDIIDCFHGKQLSYNNYLDTDAALQLIAEFNGNSPACVILKHTNPCGVALSDTLANAWIRAFETDKVSPFGGIIAFNQQLDPDTAHQVDSIFSEIILAPEFSAEAIEILTKKANRRLIRFKADQINRDQRTYRSIFGGTLVQDADYGQVNSEDLKIVTERQPTDSELQDLMFAWKIVKHVKSNAIVFAKDAQTLGIGNGQTSRVDASELAVTKAAKAGLHLAGSALASDAFFPFSDGVEAAAEAGATAIIQPGGSVRDQEVIETANRLGLTMIFTGMRHFRH